MKFREERNRFLATTHQTGGRPKRLWKRAEFFKKPEESGAYIPPAVLTQRALAEIDTETRLNLPNESALKRSIQRARREDQPELPKQMAEIPERYLSIEGSEWLLFDSNSADVDSGQ